MLKSPWKQRQLLFWLLLLAVAATAAAATAAEVTAVAATATLSTAAAPFVPPAAMSSASKSNCSRSKHVVLASFGEPEEYHTISLYFASKFPNASVHHLWLHLKDSEEKEVAQETTPKTATPAVTFHWHQLLQKRTAELKKKMVTSRNRHKSSINWRAFYRSHGIHRSVIDVASLDAYHELRSTYLHSSVNGYEYELLCFARFIGLHEFCSSKKIYQLTWIDADIPIFDPDFLDRVCLPRGYSIWSLMRGSSFLNTMKCSEIGRFVAFMLDIYAKENRHALVRAIHEHGSSDMDNAKHISEQVRQSEPAFVELGIDPKHFSDMFLFAKFLYETNARANAAEAAAAVTSLTREQQVQETKGDHPTTIANAALSQTPRMVKHPKTYIHQEENGGTIDPYFVPIVSIKNRVPYPDSQNLCTNDTIWNRYLKLSGGGGGGGSSGGGAGGAGGSKQASEASTSVLTTKTTTMTKTTRTEPKTKTATHATTSRLGLLFNDGGNDTWSPVAGAHFQGDNCKARLLSTFSEAITEAHRSRRSNR